MNIVEGGREHWDYHFVGLDLWSSSSPEWASLSFTGGACPLSDDLKRWKQINILISQHSEGQKQHTLGHVSDDRMWN